MKVQSGTLALGNDDAAGSGAVTIEAGAALSFSANDLTIANAISISGDPSFDVATGEDETIGGIISDATGGAPAGVVEKTGGGTLILEADNGYSGGTNIAAGALELADDNAGGSGPIDFTGTGTLKLDAAGTLSNRIDDFVSGDSLVFRSSGAPGDYLHYTGASGTWDIDDASGATIDQFTTPAIASGLGLIEANGEDFDHGALLLRGERASSPIAARSRWSRSRLAIWSSPPPARCARSSGSAIVRIDIPRHPDPAAVRPVRVSPTPSARVCRVAISGSRPATTSPSKVR